MSAYFLALIDIHDPARYEHYLAGFDEIFDKFQGQVVSVEDDPQVLEGKWPAGRTVLIKFPSEAALRDWYDSPEYQQLAGHRREASAASIAIIAGRN